MNILALHQISKLATWRLLLKANPVYNKLSDQQPTLLNLVNSAIYSFTIPTDISSGFRQAASPDYLTAMAECVRDRPPESDRLRLRADAFLDVMTRPGGIIPTAEGLLLSVTTQTIILFELKCWKDK